MSAKVNNKILVTISSYPMPIGYIIMFRNYFYRVFFFFFYQEEYTPECVGMCACACVHAHILGTESRKVSMLTMHSTTELYPNVLKLHHWVISESVVKSFAS
jgi:hypothetical protein